MSNPLHVTLEPGTLLAGKYRIERVLGQGGMGIVAAAYHVHLEQRVALKLMLPHAMGSPEAVGRFMREARAAARITSEHVARVYDVGSLDTGEPYIAMEYLEGFDVAQLLARQGPLPVGEAVDYLLQACEALAEAHAAGIVHRDLKPPNLYLVHRVDGQRLIKVLDFGISKVSGGAAESDAPATKTSALMGSPLYMSPEQMSSSRNVDARSDIWALGVILYELVSGKPPFDGDTLPQVCAMVITEEPTPLASRMPGLPHVVYEVVHRCLQKQPAARYQSVAELAHALAPIASARAQQSVDRISRVLGVTGSVQTAALGTPVQAISAQRGTQANWGETNPVVVAKSNRTPLIALALLAAFLLVGGGVALFARSKTAPSAAVTPPEASSPVAAAAPSAPHTVGQAPPEPVSAAPSAAAEAPTAASAAPTPTPSSSAAPTPAPARPALRPRVAAPVAAKPKPAAALPAPAPPVKPAPPSTARSRL